MVLGEENTLTEEVIVAKAPPKRRFR